MTSRNLLKAAVLAFGLIACAGPGSARAQDWTKYLHWPYVPPQNPASGAQYTSLHDGWYVYPREQRIVPQIQGPYYRNFYGGKRILGIRKPKDGFHDWDKTRFYQGHHYILDVF